MSKATGSASSAFSGTPRRSLPRTGPPPHQAPRGVPRVLVAEGVVEAWDNLLNSGEGADVTIACRGSGGSAESAGGGESPGAAAARLSAHRFVLRSASHVLSAMLSPAFREGSTARIEVDFEPAAVRLLLSLIYTGEELHDADAPVDVMLGALELAHRWDVGHAVAALECALARAIDEERFGRLMEVAARLSLPELRPACVAFAKHSPEVRRRFKAAQYPASVQAALQAALTKVFGDPDPGEARRKRRRMIMAS